MSLPPVLARIQLGTFTLWVPIVLVWPLIVLALAPAFLLGALFALVMEGLHFGAFLRACWSLGRLLCALPGTLVSIESPHFRIAITLY